MAGTIRPDTITVSTSSPIINSKSLPSASPAVKPAGKPTITAPRIDLEPLYTALKTAVGDADWTIYKDTISQFVLGNLNQEELTHRIRPFISCDPTREHLHNQFLCGIYGNVFRDAPEPGVASWVSANDKPTTGVSKQNTGDEAERRLKHEVMQLNRRERKRLKAIQESPYDPINALAFETTSHLAPKQPTPSNLSSGSGYQKTNWDIEIRKRYTQPLFAETNEIPDTEAIALRMLPICYEEGLAGGYTQDCAEFMNIATETYIKEALSNFLGRVCRNSDAYIKTASFRRQVEREESALSRGELVKAPGGFLPIEVSEAQKRKPLSMQDLRLSLELGDSYLGQVPLIAGIIANGRHLDAEPEDHAERPKLHERRSTAGSAVLVNGVGAKGLVNGTGPSTTTNGYHVDFGNSDAMAIDEPDWSWQGGGLDDLGSLNGVLDQCLSIGG